MDELPSYCLSLILAEGDAAASYPTSTIVIKLVSVLVLVAATGFFVAAEFALVGVRPSRIDTLAAAGSRSAKRVSDLMKNLNAFLSGCQLGITLASLALGWIGEPALARLLEPPLARIGLSAWLHFVSFFIAFSIITALHIVSGAGHVDLYDRTNLIPWSKLTSFFNRHLTGGSVA